MANLIVLHYFVFCLLVVLVTLSVPVQVIDWKDSSLNITDLLRVVGDIESYSLTHSLYRLYVRIQSTVSLGEKIAQKLQVRRKYSIPVARATASVSDRTFKGHDHRDD